MGVGDLRDFLKSFNPCPALKDAMREQVKLNVQSLLRGYGSGGKPLKPLSPTTVRLKGGRSTPGIDSGAMLENLSRPENVRIKRGQKGTVIGFGAPKDALGARKLTFFVAGRKLVSKEAKKKMRKDFYGRLKASAIATGRGYNRSKMPKLKIKNKTIVPARDFFGIDPVIMDKLANTMTTAFFIQKGFR